MKALRRRDEEERKDRRPNDRQDPSAHTSWLQRQLVRQAQRDKCKQYLP